MSPDRRSPRNFVEKILPIQIEPNISAIVVDTSEGGFGFRALTPLTQTGVIRFSFAENGQPVEAGAELVWTDSTKHRGGLRFAPLPDASRERFRNWVGLTAAPRPKDLPLPGASPPAAAYSPPPGLPTPQPVGGYVMYDADFQDVPTRFFSGFVSGVIASAIAVAVVLFVFGNPRALLTRSAESRASDSTTQAASQSPSPSAIVPPSAAPSPDVAPQSGTTPPVASGPVASEAVAPGQASPAPRPPAPNLQPSAAAATSQTQAPADDNSGAADLARAQRYLGGRDGHADAGAALPFLWAAVEKGNVTAEIVLANLYARGDGVAKNCKQARVLLQAAAEKGSNEASGQLTQMIRTGCS